MSVQRLLKIYRLFIPLITLLTPACAPETNETIEVGIPSPALRNPNQQRPNGPSRGSAADGSVDSDTEENPYERSKSLNQNLFSWYSVRSNYELIYRDVLKFHPDGRHNGCVAFVSAALRRVGVKIPIRSERGGPVSLVTTSFSDYLEQNLGWRRIGAATNLRAGDVVFTEENPSDPGYPAHTYVFHSWTNKYNGLALVIDNQDFTHERNIDSNSGIYNFTPFAYALRAP